MTGAVKNSLTLKTFHTTTLDELYELPDGDPLLPFLEKELIHEVRTLVNIVRGEGEKEYRLEAAKRLLGAMLCEPSARKKSSFAFLNKRLGKVLGTTRCYVIAMSFLRSISYSMAEAHRRVQETE